MEPYWPALRVEGEIHAAQFHAAHRNAKFGFHPAGHRGDRASRSTSSVAATYRYFIRAAPTLPAEVRRVPRAPPAEGTR